MTLWIILTLMTGVAAVFMTIPILRRRNMKSRPDPSGFGLFHEQTRELDREVANGTISSQDAAVTRAEIERRILAAAKGRKQIVMTELTDKGRAIGIAIAVGWVTAGSALLYGSIGRPDLAGHAAPGLDAGSGLAAPDMNTAQPLGGVDEMITRLADRLTREPGDLAGWQMLGWSYFEVGRFGDAAEAYGRAVALAPDNGELLSLQAEALISANGGSVSEAALALVERSLELEPSNPRAKYFKGVSLDEAGDTAAALGLWLAVLDSAPPDAVWLPELKVHIRERALAAGIDLGTRTESLLPPDLPLEASGPTDADIAAAAEMTPEARQEMILGMVSGLADSLKQEPDNLEGWLRLIRSYVMLGDIPAAKAALADAMGALQDQPQARLQLQSAAREFGLD
jgi:cytochrome c-type biogenesis protein CcmH